MASEASAEEQVKKVSKFDWSCVDSDLTRELLETVYLNDGRDDMVELIVEMDPEPLARQAARSLGSPLSKDHMPCLFVVLQDSWVPTLDGEDLDAVVNRFATAMSAAARAALKTKNQKRQFLQSKNSTVNSRANLRAAFISAHKKPTPVHATHQSSVVTDDAGVVHLDGQNLPAAFAPYQHKVTAWKRLDDLLSGKTVASRSALLTLPTGAGKTATAVEWALRRMEADSAVRVLWLAHQQELLEQAARAFVSAAAQRDDSFHRTLRVLSGGGPGLVALTDDTLDVAITTRQLVAAAGKVGLKRISAFLERPTIVVVDEAHHAASPTYDAILETATNAPTTTLLGLTATPWPMANGARARLQQRFPHRIDVTTGSLIATGVLATPIYHTVETHKRVKMTAEETKVAETRDLPPEVLRRLATRDRDSLIVNLWTASKETWGKTLVFATSIEHADWLTAAFKAGGVNADCVHSRVENPTKALQDFRAPTGTDVLVSVGMLTEGVDVPAARTAFMTRPTTSAILMRQMIGRVLRGPQAGGDPIAHVVYLRDQWGEFPDIIEPPDVGPGQSTASSGTGPTRSLPPVYDDTGELIELGLLNRIYQDALRSEVSLPLKVSATATELVGYYEIDETNVPVFAHQKNAYDQLIEHALAGKPLQGVGAMAFFDDLPAPSPSPRSLKSVLGWIREFAEAPAFKPLRASLDPARVADDLRKAPAMTVDERSEWLSNRFESSPIRALFADFDEFEEAVEDALRNLQRASRGVRPRDNPDGPIPEATAKTKKLPSLPYGDRNLPKLLAGVAERARDLLADELTADEELAERLDVRDLPVRFSKRPNAHAWAYWNVTFKGMNAGRPVIIVNNLLQTTEEAVPDHVLEYLLYHELLHHLLPGQGHDGQFRRLEALWPGIDESELALMTLHERWDTRPISNA